MHSRIYSAEYVLVAYLPSHGSRRVRQGENLSCVNLDHPDQLKPLWNDRSISLSKGSQWLRFKVNWKMPGVPLLQCPWTGKGDFFWPRWGPCLEVLVGIYGVSGSWLSWQRCVGNMILCYSELFVSDLKQSWVFGLRLWSLISCSVSCVRLQKLVHNLEYRDTTERHLLSPFSSFVPGYQHLPDSRLRLLLPVASLALSFPSLGIPSLDWTFHI